MNIVESSISSESLPSLFEEKAKIRTVTEIPKKDSKKLTNKSVSTLSTTANSVISLVPTPTPVLTLSFMERENSTIILNYGADAYRDLIKLEQTIIFPANFLKRHSIESHYRTKIVDWMMEVVHAFNCESETIFLSVSIMDLFLNQVKSKVAKELLHLICSTSIYMASKMEDIMPISVNSVVNKILHNKYSNKKIVEMERTIFKTISFNVVLVSPYEFIKTYIFDFTHNNENKINKLKMANHLSNLENVSIFMAKLMLHDESFSEYKSSARAIACMTFGFDALRTNSKNLTSEMEGLIKKWLIFLVKESEHKQENISIIYNKINDNYNNFEKLSFINGNIINAHKLVYD